MQLQHAGGGAVGRGGAVGGRGAGVAAGRVGGPVQRVGGGGVVVLVVGRVGVGEGRRPEPRVVLEHAVWKQKVKQVSKYKVFIYYLFRAVRERKRLVLDNGSTQQKTA